MFPVANRRKQCYILGMITIRKLMPSYTLTHYKVHYRVTETLHPIINYTPHKVEFTTEIDAIDYDDLRKTLYHKCIANRGIEYYEILGVATYYNGYWTPLCCVAGTIYVGKRK